jgi:hypothetical protein
VGFRLLLSITQQGLETGYVAGSLNHRNSSDLRRFLPAKPALSGLVLIDAQGSLL